MDKLILLFLSWLVANNTKSSNTTKEMTILFSRLVQLFCNLESSAKNDKRKNRGGSAGRRRFLERLSPSLFPAFSLTIFVLHPNYEFLEHLFLKKEPYEKNWK